ncbi:MAG TPA: hypothetical protein PLQ78_01940 [Flavipsychrobacter sp.]|jgi:hypothetical protein|nr:hypothetical protein [Flavipsychrobacter sp.]
MNIWKTVFISAFSFLGVASTVLYSSCEQDACLSLKCRNGGSCAEGFCRCKTGYEGAECETRAADKFLYLFIGQKTCAGAPVPDTVLIYLDQYPNKIKMVQYSKKEDTLTGVADKYHVRFDDYARGNYRRFSSADLSSGEFEKISIYNEYINDVTVSSVKEACNFQGFK